MINTSPFQYICELSELLPNVPRTFEVKDRFIVVVAIGGNVYSIEDLCTHDGGTLGDGELEDFLHLYLANRGIMLTPFHNMALMCPTTTVEDVAAHHLVFEQAVKEFKAVHPPVTHKVTIDWDDDSLNRIRFAWEPGTFGVVKPLLPIQVPEKIRSAEKW